MARIKLSRSQLSFKFRGMMKGHCDYEYTLDAAGPRLEWGTASDAGDIDSSQAPGGWR
jgi:hypothetical protein